MPFRYQWLLLHDGLTPAQLDGALDAMKTYAAYTTQNVRCQICLLNLDNHNMGYRILRCNSMACSSGCEWFSMILTCRATDLSSVYQHDQHVTQDRSPDKKKIKLAHRRYIIEQTLRGIRPARIQAEMVRDLPMDDRFPTLKQIQAVSYHCRQRNGLSAAFVAELNDIITRHSAVPGEEYPSTPFTFGFDVDEFGRANVGNGSDERPTFVGVTTRSLMNRLAGAQDKTLHVDATFKLNQSGYPVIVMGISDSVRSFHPVALFLTSQLTAAQYDQAFEHLLGTYSRVVRTDAPIARVMSDADDASFNAIDAVFARRFLPRPKQLMCFFHVMMNVKKHMAGMSKANKRMIKDHVYELHFARDENEFREHWARALASWNGSDDLRKFAVYFGKQWINSRFSAWQCYQSPAATAKTNNPVEQFNRAIKRDYTLGTLLPLTKLLEQLLLLAKTKSLFPSTIVSRNSPTREMMARHKYLQKANLISVEVPVRSSVGFLLSGVADVVFVLQAGIVDRNVAKVSRAIGRKKFFGAGNMRQNKFEMAGQPSRGWRVDTSALTCPCKIAFKFGFCPHLIAALKAKDRDIPGYERPQQFVNRRVGFRGLGSGRPPAVGHALSLQ